MRLLLGLAAFLAPTAALAQPSAAPATTEPAPVRVAVVPAMAVAAPGQTPLADREAVAAAQPPAPRIGISKRVDEDAAAGRAFFSDTALTASRGKFSLGVRMPAAPAANLEVGYALTDRLEVGISALTIADESDGVLGFRVKGQIWHNDRAAVAVGFQRYSATSADDSVTVPTVVATTCLDGKDCVAVFSLSLNGIVVGGDSNVPVFAGASWALGRKVQFVGELHVSNDDRGSDSLTFGYMGLRAASHSFSFDGGLAFASMGSNSSDCFDCSSSDSGAFPFFAVATRM